MSIPKEEIARSNARAHAEAERGPQPQTLATATPLQRIGGTTDNLEMAIERLESLVTLLTEGPIPTAGVQVTENDPQDRFQSVQQVLRQLPENHAVFSERVNAQVDRLRVAFLE